MTEVNSTRTVEDTIDDAMRRISRADKGLSLVVAMYEVDSSKASLTIIIPAEHRIKPDEAHLFLPINDENGNLAPEFTVEPCQENPYYLDETRFHNWKPNFKEPYDEWLVRYSGPLNRQFESFVTVLESITN